MAGRRGKKLRVDAPRLEGRKFDFICITSLQGCSACQPARFLLRWFLPCEMESVVKSTSSLGHAGQSPNFLTVTASPFSSPPSKGNQKGLHEEKEYCGLGETQSINTTVQATHFSKDAYPCCLVYITSGLSFGLNEVHIQDIDNTMIVLGLSIIFEF